MYDDAHLLPRDGCVSDQSYRQIGDSYNKGKVKPRTVETISTSSRMDSNAILESVKAYSLFLDSGTSL